MVQKIRRYVTGHDKDGKAIVAFDDHAPNAVPLKGWPGAGVTAVWVTGEMPVNNMGREDQSLRPLRRAQARCLGHVAFDPGRGCVIYALHPAALERIFHADLK